VAACGGDAGAPATTTVPSPTTTTAVDPLAGFASRIVTVSGETWAVAVADTPALRAQGLMGITDLGALDGMLFVWDEDVASGFWMKDTLIPLDVAFFTATGELVDLLRMEPCVADPCPVYRPAAPYRFAIETEVGRWDAIDRPGLTLGE
jgi:hypothetical protein